MPNDAGAAPRFDHVGLAVRDLEAMTAWYCERFNMRVQHRFDLQDIGLQIAMLVDGTGRRFELLHRDGGVPGLRAENPLVAAATEGYGHACFVVADLPGAFDATIGAGASPVFDPRPSPEAGVDMAWVHDPEGNLVELITPPPVTGS